MDGKTSQADVPVLSKEVAPFVLAFLNGWNDVLCFKQYKAYTLRHTGSTMNFASNTSNRDFANVRFFVAVLLHYCGGCAIWKYIDTMLKGRGSCTAAAPVVLALQAGNDTLRHTYPESRWHMLTLAMSNGLFNTCGAEKLGCLTHVITGHYQKVSTDMVLWRTKGLSKEQLRATLKSCLVLVSFFLGAYTGTALGNLKHEFISQCSKYKFGLLGIGYAALLTLHELPAHYLFGKTLVAPSELTGNGKV